MKTLPIETYGSEVLRHKAEPVREITPEIRRFADKMCRTMHDADGIGLAAPQVGRSIRLVIVDVAAPQDAPAAEALSEGEKAFAGRMPIALVNPEIVEESGARTRMEEGCLSIPKVNAEVVRPATVRLRARLLDGTEVDTEFGGLLGRCIQHEIDHLNGVLFIDRISKLKRELYKRRVRKQTRHSA